MLNATGVRTNTRRMLILAMLAALLMSLALGLGHANADNSVAQLNATPLSAAKGSTFTITGSGFTAGEKITLWTTAPDGTAATASYIYADNDGTFTMKVMTADPYDEATDGNYTTLNETFDDDGNLVSHSWELILKDSPALGSWHLTGFGNSSSALQVYNFNITQ